MHRTLERILLGALVLLGSCVVSPQPSPPNLTPAGVTGRAPVAGICIGCVELIGAPGTVEPPGAELVITPLDTLSPPQRIMSESDGSFETIVDAIGELRLSVRDGGSRSAPFDFVADVDGNLSLPSRPLEACLVISPELDLGEVTVGVAQPASIVVQNDCGDAIRFAPSSTRLMPSEVRIGSDVAALDPGESGAVSVTVELTMTGPLEATVFIQADAPEVDRRPITVFANGIE